ncbi:MAG: TAXI family TRAP transporter solute-binding subunit [Planctomycetota bacterium]
MTIKSVIRIVAVLGLILLPFVIRWLYLGKSARAGQIVIASGRAQGRYRAISEALARRIEEKLETPVTLVSTNGSLDNLRRLQNGTADFALYQPGALESLSGHAPDASAEAVTSSREGAADEVAFLANVYSQPAHLVVRRGAGIAGAADLKGRRVSLGLPNSGDLAMSLMLLDHLNLDVNADIEARTDLNYADLERLFQEGGLDAALVAVGVQADVYRKLAEMGECEFLGIPNVEALARNNLYVSPYTIPKGLYGFDPAVPGEDIETVAAAAQLLTRGDVPKQLVHAVTEIVHEKQFIKENRLWELLAGGHDFALQRPEYPLHPGARAYYHPELRPLLDPGFVESTEGTISLLCSTAIAIFFLCRWLRTKRARMRDHRLDRYIRELLDIERRQMPLDEGGTGGDVGALQRLLDEVTTLRQEALSEFTAHQLNDDHGPDCFIHLCHALSDKINAKLTRQQESKLMGDLIAAVEGRSDGPAKP